MPLVHKIDKDDTTPLVLKGNYTIAGDIPANKCVTVYGNVWISGNVADDATLIVYGNLKAESIGERAEVKARSIDLQKHIGAHARVTTTHRGIYADAIGPNAHIDTVGELHVNTIGTDANITCNNRVYVRHTIGERTHITALNDITAKSVRDACHLLSKTGDIAADHVYRFSKLTAAGNITIHNSCAPSARLVYGGQNLSRVTTRFSERLPSSGLDYLGQNVYFDPRRKLYILPRDAIDPYRSNDPSSLFDIALYTTVDGLQNKFPGIVRELSDIKDPSAELGKLQGTHVLSNGQLCEYIALGSSPGNRNYTHQVLRDAIQNYLWNNQERGL